MSRAALLSRRVVLPVVGMAVLFGLSAVPASRLPASGGIPGVDKLVHAVLYALLTLSFVPPRRERRLLREWLPGALATVGTFAALDELHQVWVPGRSPDLLDWLADAAGAAVASVWLARSLPK